MRKIIICILTVVMVFCLFAFIGCGNSESENGTPINPEPEKPTPVEPEPSKEETDPNETLTLSFSTFDSIELLAGNSFNVPLTVTYNGSRVNPVVTLKSENESVATASLENGKIKINALSQGTTKILVTAVHNGKQAEKYVSVSVKKNISIAFACNGVKFEDNEYQLNVDRAVLDGNKYISNLFDLGFSLVVDGNDLSDSQDVEWTNTNNSVAEIVDGKLDVKKEGTTVVSAKYVHTDKSVYQAKLNVNVASVVLQKNKSDVSYLPFEMKELTSDPVLAHPSLFKAGEIKSVTIGGKDVLASLDTVNSTITLDRDKMKTCEYGVNELTVKTDLVTFKYRITLCDKLIMNKGDLDSLNVVARNTEDPSVWDGYYMLGADIEYNGTFKTIAPISVGGAKDVGETGSELTGFRGTLDGNGHIVNGVTVGNGTSFGAGMFGSLGNGAVIKNIAFTNVRVLHGGGYSGFLASQVAKATIKDVFIAGSIDKETDGFSFASLTFGIGKAEISGKAEDGFHMENVMAILDNYPSPEKNYKTEPFLENAKYTYSDCIGLHWVKQPIVTGITYSGSHISITKDSLKNRVDLSTFSSDLWSEQKNGDLYYFVFNNTIDLINLGIYNGPKPVITEITDTRVMEFDKLTASGEGEPIDIGTGSEDNIVIRPSSWDR